MAGLCLAPWVRTFSRRVFLRSSGSTSRPFPSAHPQLSKARPLLSTRSPARTSPQALTLLPGERLPSLGRACPPLFLCPRHTALPASHSLTRPSSCVHGPLPGQPFPPPSTLSLGSPFMISDFPGPASSPPTSGAQATRTALSAVCSPGLALAVSFLHSPQGWWL